MSVSKNIAETDSWQQAEQAENTLKEIKEYVLNHDARGLKTCILQHKLKDQLIFWEVTSLLATCMTADVFNLEPYFFETCEKCINYLIGKGNPKELLLALLEQADTFRDDVKFKTILEFVQKILLLLPSKQEYSLAVALETLSAHIKELDLPQEYNLERKEKILLEASPEVKRITDVVLAYLGFLKPFVMEVSIVKLKNSEKNFARQRNTLLKHLMAILGYPLLYLDLSFDVDAISPKTDSHLCAEQIIELISHLRGDFNNLMNDILKQNEKILTKQNKKCSEDDKNDSVLSEEGMSKESLSCFIYLIHVENLNFDRFPSIFTHTHIFTINLEFAIFLIHQQESLIIFKGVCLMQKLLSRIRQQSLPADMLEIENYKNVLNALVNIAIHCPVKELRQSCVAIFPVYMRKYTIEGRYKIFKIMYNTCTHSGFLGFLSQLLKDEVNDALKEQHPKNYFVGSNLENLILQYTVALPLGPATDLVENSDRIISVLNFLRYLILRDVPTENVTGFWDYFPQIEQNYFSKLRTGLVMSKAHYSMELTNLQEGKTSKTEVRGIELDLVVGGESMSELSAPQQMEVVAQCLNTFDMIDSILCRVTELADMQKQKVANLKNSDG